MACLNNMNSAGLGFGMYAGDFHDALPIASASQPGDPWWEVGKRAEHSNSANLYTLARTGFTKLEDLACCGNARACRNTLAEGQDWTCITEVSYSYQNLFAQERPRWTGATRVVVIADASPVVRRAIRGQMIFPFENSTNHGGHGQNILWNDGTAHWVKTPVLGNGDNIWLPQTIERLLSSSGAATKTDPLSGTETPNGGGDVMLGP